jgi:hypothetical protein
MPAFCQDIWALLACCAVQGPLVFNVLNTSARTPGNPEILDETQRTKVYEEVCKVVHDVRIKSCPA